MVLALASLFQFSAEYRKVIDEPMSSWTRTQSADCAVVLTGGPSRVREGFDLLANQYVKKLIISGVNPNSRLREIMPVWSFYGNLNENDVVLEKRSETTYGNAQQSLSIVETLHCRDIILVTSRSHMHRAFKTFRGAFPENIEIFKHAVVSGHYEVGFWEASFEALKSLFYSLWAY
ncbi:MAG TPA: YdcF family protein [Pseudobdellovibrionaceae bacterium]